MGALLVIALAGGCLRSSTSGRTRADGHWHLRETRPGTYHMTVHGAHSALGSTVTVYADSAEPSMYGQAEYGVPLRPPAMQRISVAADVRPQGVRDRAVIWLRADRDGAPLVTEYAQIPARGNSDWQRQETGLVVPDDASAITYGVLLQGPGEVSVRHLTVEATRLPPPETAVSASARVELDSALHVARANALWRDTIQWPLLEARVRRAAAGASAPGDVYPAIRLLAAELGDHHSSLYTPQDMATFRSGANTPTADVRAMTAGVGYVNSPGYIAENGDSTAAYVRRTYAALRAATPASACGWVVDLRENTGGAPEPMLAALAPFFGPSGPSGLMRAVSRRVGVAVPRDLLQLMQAQVAVLLGPQTGSAGERVAEAFRQRPHTRSFGQPTAGVATTRRMVLLPDGAALAIATSPMDSTRVREQSLAIAPDVVVGDQAGRGDRTLKAAWDWLTTMACTARTRR